MGVLMLGPAQWDTATVDECTTLGAGYTYFHGYRYKFQPEHPPLSQMLPVVPLLVTKVDMSDDARGLLEGRLSYPWAVPWFGEPVSIQYLIPPGCQGRMVPLPQPPYHSLVAWQCTGMYPTQDWYYWTIPEGQLFGEMLVYGSGNDADTLLFTARCVQILLALGVGFLIFWWVRCARPDHTLAAAAALSAWVFNPNALAYGHLASTGDIAVTLGITAGVFFFARFLESPTQKNAVVTGVATGIALVMKFTAITLAPIYAVLAVMSWKRVGKHARNLWKPAILMFGAVWLVLLAMYFPRWAPAQPPTDQQTQVLAVPGWFTQFRPVLIPPDFFKGLALLLGHSKGGHDAYLLGEWSHTGWLSYFPMTFVLKNSPAFVVLALASVVIVAIGWRWRSPHPLEMAPWVASILYMLAAMTSKVNIGVRHLLPMFAMLCVAIGLALTKLSSKTARGVVIALLGWQCCVTILAYPLYIQFFSEAVGGARNGQKYLLDSNYDWGQDAKRLKQFVADRGISHIYLDYFGTQYSIEYLKIPNTRVNAEQARRLNSGWLVVSASELMRPEWAWLRESREPTTRVAYTLFAYQLGPAQ
jgi:hypothetical protein